MTRIKTVLQQRSPLTLINETIAVSQEAPLLETTRQVTLTVPATITSVSSIATKERVEIIAREAVHRNLLWIAIKKMKLVITLSTGKSRRGNT
jgi:hypothetical protein